MPRAEIDSAIYDSPYYIVPDDRVGQEAFAVIRDAMRAKDMVALGRVVLAKRERVITLEPWDKGLMGTTLRYAYEVRDTPTIFSRHCRHEDRQGHAGLPSISLRLRPAISSRKISTTAMRMRWSKCCGRSRRACRRR